MASPTGRLATTVGNVPAAPAGNVLPLFGAALLPPIVVATGLATNAWPHLLLAGVAAALLVAPFADIRWTVLVALFLGTFVDYTTGKLTMEIAILSAWIAWSALLLAWRSAWKGWVLPPRAYWPGVAVWLAVCAFGCVAGLFQGHRFQNIGIELVAALWPLMALGIIQVFDRKSLGHAGVAVILLGLVHTVFGLTMLQAYHQRLGGIYFTTLTGIVAVGLWAAAVLAPRRKVRILALIAMVPMLAHLFFSFTRGYWLGFIAGFLAATALAWRDLGRHAPGVRLRRLALIPALVAVLAVTVGFALLYFGGPGLLESAGGRFESSFSAEATGATLSNVVRLDEYDRAIGAALHSPIVGRGLGFSFVTRDFLTRTLKDQWFVHNYYLLLWLKIGLLGLAAFAFLIGSFLRQAVRVADRDHDWLVRVWSITAVAATVDVLVILITNYSLADLTTASVVAFIWGVFWSIRSAETGSGICPEVRRAA